MIKAYYEQPNKKDFSCKIVDKIAIDNNTYYLFDIAPFFPGGGGEERDEGTADGLSLVEALENEDKVYYSFSGELGEVGDTVKCEVNTLLRNSRRIMHTSQHIISALLCDIYNMPTVSVHFSSDYAAIDIDGDGLTEDELKFIERKANEIVRCCIPLETFIATKEELSELPLRKNVEAQLSEPRIVRIADIDVSLCCAVHVDNTGNIGIIKILKTEHKGGVTKVIYTSGQCALEDYYEKNTAVNKLNALLSSTTDNLIERVKKKDEDINTLKKQIAKLRESYAELEVESIINSDAVVITKEGTFDELKTLGSKLAEKAQKAFIGIDRAEEKIIVYQKIDKPVNTVINILKGKYEVKGGGNALSGQIMCKGCVDEIVNELTSYFDPASLYSDVAVE